VFSIDDWAFGGHSGFCLYFRRGMGCFVLQRCYGIVHKVDMRLLPKAGACRDIILGKLTLLNRPQKCSSGFRNRVTVLSHGCDIGVNWCGVMGSKPPFQK
jgi:hypothetical protein